MPLTLLEGFLYILIWCIFSSNNLQKDRCSPYSSVLINSFLFMSYTSLAVQVLYAQTGKGKLGIFKSLYQLYYNYVLQYSIYLMLVYFDAQSLFISIVLMYTVTLHSLYMQHNRLQKQYPCLSTATSPLVHLLDMDVSIVHCEN